MKKTLCAVLALMLCIAVAFTGCNKDDTTSKGGSVEDNSGADAVVVDSNNNNSNSVSSNNDVRSDNEIQEGESVAEAYIGEQVELFVSGKYYLEGTVYSPVSDESDGSTTWGKMPVKLATDGANCHYTTSISGINLSVLILDGAAYLIEPSTSVYVELSKSLVKALGLDSDISEITSFNPNSEENIASKITQTAVTINGENGLCNEYIYEDSSVKLYSIGDKLIQVDNYDENGNLEMQITVDSIVGTIPSNQLTLKGLEKVSITSFASALKDAALAQ